jgi:hypothetical protein
MSIQIPLYIFLPSAGLFVGVPALLIVIRLIKNKKRNKRNPLCRDILRGPGESLRIKLAELNDKIEEKGMMLLFWPTIMVGASFSQMYFIGKQFNAAAIITYGGGTTFVIIYFAIQYYKLLRERIAYALGLDAELAVGRELNYLMLAGFHVYHDFPEEKNNIDHIVIGPSGVFAVETKGKSKPDRKRGSADAKVVYDGQRLIFPDNETNSEFIVQAKKQSASLSKWLSKAVGEPVDVKPVLALPGWFVERRKPDLTILYGYAKDYLKALQGKAILSEELIQRIVHQVEQKCRDVAPKAYQKQNGKSS